MAQFALLWLSTHHNHWPRATSIVWCCYLRRSTNPHNSGRSILHCCWSTSVEKSTTSSLWLWTIAFRDSPVTENAFVWLKIEAPSDLLLDVVRLINVLTYFTCCVVHCMLHDVLWCSLLTGETSWLWYALWCGTRQQDGLRGLSTRLLTTKVNSPADFSWCC